MQNNNKINEENPQKISLKQNKDADLLQILPDQNVINSLSGDIKIFLEKENLYLNSLEEASKIAEDILKDDVLEKALNTLEIGQNIPGTTWVKAIPQNAIRREGIQLIRSVTKQQSAIQKTDK